MSIRSLIDTFIGNILPARLASDREMRTRARMFLFSHLFGPFLGNVIPLYLFVIDPGSRTTLWVLAGSISSFWLYPFALRLTGCYRLLSYLSIQNLLFAIFWGCYFYGGISSPFLPWLVTVPLLAFFYLGASQGTIAVILSQVAINGVVFVLIYRTFGETAARVPLAELNGIGIISTLSAAIYVSMMAIYYARVLDSQTELETEVAGHLATAAELRAAAAEAERAGAAKADFLAKMSHELRTPLNAVIGYSQILMEDADPRNEPQIVVDLDRIHSAGNRLLSIVNAILDLSKIEAGKMSVDVSACPVTVVLSSLGVEHGQTSSRNDNDVSVVVAPGIGSIECDLPKLARVLNLLLDNALQYTRRGSVSIEASSSFERGVDIVCFTVADTGSGIAPELMPFLFEDFTQRNNRFTSDNSGAGLGLPLADRLCRLIGGSLQIESTVGIGTRVTVRIPRLAPTDRCTGPVGRRSATTVPLAA